MNRSKRLGVLAGALAAVCVVTFAVSRYEKREDDIRTSGEVVFELPFDSVQSVSWVNGDLTLAFHRDGEDWRYDGDEAFPVDPEKMRELLSPFEALRASFVIESPENLSQYGLDDPACTIEITADDGDYTVLIGDFSSMDEERYVSVGDGNVYLAAEDPFEYFDVQLKDLILQDEIPDISGAVSITFAGMENYTLAQDEEGESYREEDLYFADGQPLDSDKVRSYLNTLRYLNLTNYVAYSAGEEDLSQYGLDEPELTIQVTYPGGEDSSEEEIFTLRISRDPEELAEAREAADEAAETAEGEEAGTDVEAEVSAYARVGDSSIIYSISPADFAALTAVSYDDLRHDEIFPAPFDDVIQLDIVLDGESYTFAAEGEEEERTFRYNGEEIDIGAFKDALEGMTAAGFTSETPAGQQEISVTAHLDLEGSPTVALVFYRYDGESCLAVVDGQAVALVEHRDVVNLMETVNAVVLG